MATESPIQIEDITPEESLRDLVVRQQDGVGSTEQIRLPPVPKNLSSLSASSLVESMNLAEKDEKSLGLLLKSMHSNLLSALEEVGTVTTHDDNLEKQYRETAAENVKLKAALDRARHEITHLKGRLSTLEHTPAEIREERNRINLQQKKLRQQEQQLQKRIKYKGKDFRNLMTVLTQHERSRTVNARGEYIDYSEKQKKARNRVLSYPFTATKAATAAKAESRPPPLIGCECSVCNTQQSLGALTLGKRAQVPLQMTKSGQQILLGDRVVIRGEQLGTVKYIGKLEFDHLDRVFIGVHLDAPVGITDGALRGKRYFQCPANHGVFILPPEVLGVTGRKPRTTGTVKPRPRPRLKPILVEHSHKKPEIKEETGTMSSSESSLANVKREVERELQQLLVEGASPTNLMNPSVNEMAKRITELRSVPRPPLAPLDDRITEEEEDDDKNEELMQEPEIPLDTKENEEDIVEPETTQTQEEEKESEKLMENEDIDGKPALHDVLQSTFMTKDIGNSGFITIKELTSALKSEIKVTDEELDEIFDRLGLKDTEGRGIEYNGLAPLIAEAVTHVKSKSELNE